MWYDDYFNVKLSFFLYLDAFDTLHQVFIIYRAAATAAATAAAAASRKSKNNGSPPMVYRSYCRALKAFALVYLELHTTLWKERESVCVWVGERERERKSVCAR